MPLFKKHSALSPSSTPAARGLQWLAAPAVALVLMCAGTANAQSYANVTIGGQFAPGVYGQIALGNNPPPPVINVQPVIVGRPIHGAPVMYLHVPPEESRDWGRHCERYHACGRPVQFVRVEQDNRWWERHGEHLRGEDHYRKPEHNRGSHNNRRRDDGEENRH